MYTILRMNIVLNETPKEHTKDKIFINIVL